MSGWRAENYRRTTQRLIAQDRQLAASKEFLATLSPSRRAEVAAWLLARLAAELPEEHPSCGAASTLALRTELLAEQILQHAVAGSAPGTLSPRESVIPAAAPVPSTGPTAVSNLETRNSGRSSDAR